MIFVLHVFKKNIEVNLRITFEHMSYIFQFYDLNEKNETARQNDFIFNQIDKVTIKIDSNFFQTNIC